ncbi:vitamin K epoxide reductase family protein [Ferruginibacter sp.]
MLQPISSRLSQTAYQYVQHLSIPVTKKTLQKRIEENPYYPTLYSLNDVFDKLNIPNQSFRIDPTRLDEMETPFVAYMKLEDDEKDFVLVTGISAGQISYISSTNRSRTMNREKFIEKWEKIVFVAERSDKSGEPDYEKHLMDEKKASAAKTRLVLSAILIVGLLIGSFLFSTGAAAFSATAILLLKLSGIAVTALLLVYDIDKSNQFVKSVCTGGTRTNCDAVLNSKAAKISGISWGELGFFYFMGSTLFLLLPGISYAAKISWLAVANCVAATYIPFSLYYQWKIVKQWCTLCLSVQAILLLELTWSMVNFWQHPALPPISGAIAVNMLTATLVPITAWYIIKPVWLRLKARADYQSAYKRLFYNPSVFQGLLNQEETAAPGYQDIGITLGNPAATQTIIKVCNPYCGPCAKAHPALEEILHRNDDVKIKIIFTAANNEQDKAAIVVKHLLAIAAKGNAQQTQQALDDWYLAPQKDYPSFAAKYPMNGELKMQDAKVEAMTKWCKASSIMYTPTLFVNEKILPENYSINELNHFF